MKNWKVVLISAAAVFAVIIMGIFYINGFQNKAIVLEEKVNAADSDIKVQEQRRYDLFRNMVDTVKEYDEHEYNTLMDVVAARGTGSDSDIEEVKTMIAATAEAYPELKSSENYRQYMNELSITENLIATYREVYNDKIEEYNRYVRKFPNKQMLTFVGYDPMIYEYLDYDAPVEAPTNLFNEN